MSYYTCLEKHFDLKGNFDAINFANWDAYRGVEPGTTEAEAKAVRLSRGTRVEPAVDPDLPCVEGK